jgi:hypothetical protein
MNFKKLKFWSDYSDIIEFYCHEEIFGSIPEPKPAQKNLPEWFRDLSPISSHDEFDHFGNPVMSAKKCLPLLDAMSMGFTIPLPGEIRVRSNHDCSQIEVTNPPNFIVAEFHKSNQVGGKNKLKPKQGDPIKFINRWVIKTAPGWSTLFIPPMNVFNSPFTCLSGLVDTDKYPKEVNFPAIWNIPNANINIRAGTPLVTAIPINREVFKVFKKTPKIKSMANKEFKVIDKIQKAQSIRNHVYTEELRVKK